MVFFSRFIIVILLFLFFSFSFVFVGNPISPAWASLLNQKEQLFLAVVGDSRAHAGLSAQAISASFSVQKRSAYNFAVDGTDILHHYSFIVNGLLKKNQPKVIIWAPNPLQFNEKRNHNRLDQLGIYDIAPLVSAGAPLEMLLDIGMESIFPAYRHRPFVAHVIEDYSERAGKRTLKYQQKYLGLKVISEPVSRVYLPQDDGQVPFRVLNWEDRFVRGAKAYESDYANFRISDWRMRLARDLMRKVHEAGSILIILELPVAPYFQGHLAIQKEHLKWREQMATLAQEENAVVLFHANTYSAPGDDLRFGDPGHMDLATAMEYSKTLGASLTQRLAFVRSH